MIIQWNGVSLAEWKTLELGVGCNKLRLMVLDMLVSGQLKFCYGAGGIYVWFLVGLAWDMLSSEQLKITGGFIDGAGGC